MTPAQLEHLKERLCKRVLIIGAERLKCSISLSCKFESKDELTKSLSSWLVFAMQFNRLE